MFVHQHVNTCLWLQYTKHNVHDIKSSVILQESNIFERPFYI